jgi:LmbE family N-acetylglucosaminyl deacetylase
VIPLGLPAGPLRIVCVGAHPDDVEIGCGGTLLTLAESRAVQATIVLPTGTPERHAEARKAAAAFLPGAEVEMRLLGLQDGRLPAAWDTVKTMLEDVAAASPSPDVVFAPRGDDAHQDHRLVAELTPTVWRDALVLRYEIPKWDGDLGRVSHYVPLDPALARRKVALLDECYPSQAGRDWWDDETFLGLMRLRGIECRHRYAEGFVVDKAVLSLT